MSSDLEALRHDETFTSSPYAMCAMDEDFVIRAVNPAYTAMVGLPEDALVSFGLFDVFPENPGDPDSDGHVQIRRSGERVLREARTHHLLLQRYDLRDRHEPRDFQPRYWVPLNRPLIVEDRVVGIINRVHPTEEPEAETMAALRAIRDAADGGFFMDQPADEQRLGSFLEAVDRLNTLGREVSQLRAALVSRATIEQAKGLIMAERHCTPDEAFRVLVRLSNDSNVRVADVARALVYKAQAQRG